MCWDEYAVKLAAIMGETVYADLSSKQPSHILCARIHAIISCVLDAPTSKSSYYGKEQLSQQSSFSLSRFYPAVFNTFVRIVSAMRDFTPLFYHVLTHAVHDQTSICGGKRMLLNGWQTYSLTVCEWRHGGVDRMAQPILKRLV